MKRPLVEQTLAAGRQYLQEEGEDNRLSAESTDSDNLGIWFYYIVAALSVYLSIRLSSRYLVWQTTLKLRLDLSPLTIFHSGFLSGPYLGKYKRD